MTETLMALVADYGAIGLAVILAINCLGVPFPSSLLMLAAGSLIAQGDMNLWSVIGFGFAGAVIGDLSGYAIGRWGGQAAVDAAVRRFHAGDAATRAIDLVHKWGAEGVFFSRWLFSPLGPYVNLVSGAAGFPWARFLVWGAAGEAIWVVGYVSLGYIFSTRVQQLAALLGDFTWFLVGAAATVALGAALWRARRHAHPHDHHPGGVPGP